MFDVEKKLHVRHCPRCTFPLEAVDHEGVELDHCHRCGGTFLDPHEEAEKLGSFASPATWKNTEIATFRGSGELICPHDQAVMDKYKVAFDGEKVNVDVCPQCAGLWLDANEGIMLRQIVMTAGQDFNTGVIEKPSGAETVGGYVFQLLSGFPMEVWNPIHKTPWLTISTIALLFSIFLFQTINGAWIIEQFAVLPDSIRQGQHLLSLLTSSFLHGSWLHLIGNIYFLYVFGDNIEDTLGAWRFVMIYVVAAIAGSLLQAFTQPDSAIHSLGASDAIAGMMGAYFVLFPRVKLYIMIFVFRVRIPSWWFLGFWIGFNLIRGMAFDEASNVAWMAHVGGFAVGALLGYLFKPKAFVDHFAKHSV
jgi:membrane associated rhomboid family serine protease/Zn-finger nucleic acid-binding protein